MLVTPYLQEIIQIISKYPTISITAPTGSGKSIGIPAAVAAANARIFVVVPTRTAAISLYEYQNYIQKQSGDKVNSIVGYAAEGNIHYNDFNKIVYATGGHVRRKMLSYFNKGIVSPMTFCDVLMVDEVHSGFLDTTMIISLWLIASKAKVQVPRLLVASATPVPLQITPKPYNYIIDAQHYPISYHYLREQPNEDNLYDLTGQITANIHKTHDYNTGHMLIFAAGSNEVEQIILNINKYLGDDKTADVIPAFSALKQDDLNKIYRKTSSNERKIVVATNIAEMSITIEDVGFVIDTLLEKRAETSTSGGLRLVTTYISKDSAKQRAGRTGRTRPGECYRLCTQEFYDSLEDHRPSEIERVPIYEAVIQLFDVGLKPESVLTDVNPQKITTSISLLNKLGMLQTVNHAIKATESGHFVTHFPLSVRNAGFIWEWLQAGHPVFPGIVVACIIDYYGPSYFYLPRKEFKETNQSYKIRIEAHKTKYFNKFIGYNDLDTALNMWSALTEKFHGIDVGVRELLRWTNKNSLNHKKVRELLKAIKQSINALERLKYPVIIGPFNPINVMNAARPLLAKMYSDNILTQTYGIKYISSNKEQYVLDSRNNLNKMVDNPPKGIMALSTIQIGHFNVISFGVDTEVDEKGVNLIKKKQVSKTIQSSKTTQNLNQTLSLLSELNL